MLSFVFPEGKQLRAGGGWNGARRAGGERTARGERWAIADERCMEVFARLFQKAAGRGARSPAGQAGVRGEVGQNQVDKQER